MGGLRRLANGVDTYRHELLYLREERHALSREEGADRNLRNRAQISIQTGDATARRGENATAHLGKDAAGNMGKSTRSSAHRVKLTKRETYLSLRN